MQEHTTNGGGYVYIIHVHYLVIIVYYYNCYDATVLYRHTQIYLIGICGIIRLEHMLYYSHIYTYENYNRDLL